MKLFRRKGRKICRQLNAGWRSDFGQKSTSLPAQQPCIKMSQCFRVEARLFSLQRSWKWPMPIATCRVKKNNRRLILRHAKGKVQQGNQQSSGATASADGQVDPCKSRAQLPLHFFFGSSFVLQPNCCYFLLLPVAVLASDVSRNAENAEMEISEKLYHNANLTLSFFLVAVQTRPALPRTTVNPSSHCRASVWFFQAAERHLEVG